MAKELRGDVQGLRAVAVLTVIAAHAGLPFLPGGYVGVDVFFVISGFLISSLLFREVLASGSLSLAGFWSRRARRILPAATVVTVVTVLAALAWTSLIDARQVVIDAGWATAFAANVHFAQQDLYYFAQSSAASPLQHYWSLAVEEQFYLAWPLLLLGCLGVVKLVRRVRRGHTPDQQLPRKAVLAMLLALTATSFTWSVVQTAEQPGSAYFSTLTRAWELGVGAMIALIPAAAASRLSRRTVSAMGVVGLAAIVVACVVYTPETAFPGYAAALPVLGAALLLAAGLGGQRPVTDALLDSRPMRVTGDWSYSLYLWHWPALILSERLVGRSLTPLETVVAVAVTVALSGLTYRFVETPFRVGRPARALRVPRAMVLYPVSITLVAATCLGSWQWTAYQAGEQGNNPPITVDLTGQDKVLGGHDATVALVRASVDAARNNVAIPSDLSPNLLDLRDSIADVGDCDYTEAERRLCAHGDADGSRTVVVIGDSHARAWIPAFDRIADVGEWKSYYLVKAQCPAAHVVVAPLDEERPFTECSEFQDWVIDQVDSIKPDLVVVASSPPVNGVYDGDNHYEAVEKIAPLLEAGYDELFRELGAATERLVLLRDVPRSPGDPGDCLTQREPSLEDCMFEPVERSRTLGDVAVDSAELAGAEVVDPTPWLCYLDDCPVVIGGTLTYRDTDHITTEYAATLAGALGRSLGMIE
ncbi:MAG: acyltransferase family protein [Nocardioides sp.]